MLETFPTVIFWATTAVYMPCQTQNTVEVWDFESFSPTKVMNFLPNSQPCLGLDDVKFLKDRYFGQSYLVESMGVFVSDKDCR